MRYVKTALWILPALALLGAAASMFYLPETIPIQVNFTGEYSNFGSKFVLFIFPVITFLIPVSHKSQGGKFKNTNPCLLLVLELVIIGVELYAISMGLNYK